MGRKSNLNIIAAGGVTIIMFFFIYRYGGGIGLSSATGSILFNLLPGFIIIIACVFTISEVKGVGKLGGSLGMGISLCYLIERLDFLGLITPEMLSGLTISQIQIWIIIIATIIGIILYASS